MVKYNNKWLTLIVFIVLVIETVILLGRMYPLHVNFPLESPDRGLGIFWRRGVDFLIPPAQAERPIVLIARQKKREEKKEKKKEKIAEIEIPSRPVVGVLPKAEQLIRITGREAREIAFSFGGFGVGVYDSTSFQRMEANGLRVDWESNPYWSPWLEAYFNTIFGRIEGKFWYQRQAFRSKNPAIAEELMHTFFGLEMTRTVDFDLGIRLERAANFVRSGNSVDNQALLYVALLIGKTVVLPLGDAYFLKSQLLLEGAPLGNIRSVGFIARASIGYQQLKRFFTRELEFSLRPLYQWVSPAKTQLLAHFNVALILSWDFEIWERVRHD